MLTRIFIAVLAFTVAGPVLAQERAAPESKAEVQLSFAPVVRKVAPAVVNIYTKRTVVQRVNPFMSDPFFAPLFEGGRFGGRLREHVESALGSGVIVQPDGLVVTNAHVIRDAQEITVVLNDGREFSAKLALSDDPSDLALLRLDARGESLPFAPLKPSESLEVGDIVLAIGNPFGVGQTVTSGIVSAQGRSSLDISDFNFFIQTDAAINPGNSGGPLVDMQGGVVGINTAIFSRSGGSLGIGFAVPSEMVESVIAAEAAGGDRSIVRPWLGVTAQTVTGDIAASLGMDRPRGALISKLHRASPLAKAGMKVGDVVLAVNGREIRDPSEMKFRMATVKLGETASMEVSRAGAMKTFGIRAVAAPDDPPRGDTVLKGRHPLNGVTVANMNPAVAVELDMQGEEEEGVVVVDPGRSSLLRMLGRGDMILEINGRETGNVQDVERALKAGGAQGWSFIVSSRGQVRKLLIR